MVAASESRDDLSSDVTNPARFIAAIRHALVTELVEALMQGTCLLALTAPAGAGKTSLANLLRQELLDRSVSILRIDCRSTDKIDLRTLASQLLDKDTAEFSVDDIEALSNVLMGQPVAGEKRVLIIDDAERLAGDVLVYLRLQSNVAAAEMPQIVLFADPSLWNAAGPPNRVDVRGLITHRRELQLLDDNEAKAFATLCMPELAFGEGAIDALVRHGEGLIGRITSLLAIAATIRDERRLPQLTAAEIEEAASSLLPIDDDAQDEPVGQTASELFLRPEAIDHERRGSRRRAALISALVSLPIVLAAATTAYWWSAWQPDLMARAEFADHRATPPVKTSATAQETAAPDAERTADATESKVASTEPAPPVVAAATARLAEEKRRAAELREAEESTHNRLKAAEATRAAEEQPKANQVARLTDEKREAAEAARQPAVTAAQPAPPVRPATAQTEATVREHVGDVHEAPAARALPVADVRPLLARAGAMLALGNIVAARLFYERAAAFGSAEAATSIGKTYDPAFLVSIAAAGTAANPGLAASWYREAAKLGDPEAARRLATMTAGR